MVYGNTIQNRKVIKEQAKEKKDGVYRLRGIAYRVREKRVTHVACDGEVLESFGVFDVVIGKYDGYGDGAVKKLREI